MASHRRRLAQDQAVLMNSPPPDYFFSPSYMGDNLSLVSIYLRGPVSTPFESGAFHLTLRIPPSYPQEPPKANFHTKIFHPNVDERTGDVCVDTLKRDWNPKLTLYDVLVTIRCLLVYPNPTSSLNEAAGKLLLEDYDGFAKHARLITEVHAPVPEELREAIEETRRRDAPEGAGPNSSNPDLAAPALQSHPVQEKRTQPKPAKPIIRTSALGGRKIKRPVSPTSRPRSPSGNASDSEGGESGKENAVYRRTTSPTGSKRSREQSEESDIPDNGLPTPLSPQKPREEEESGRKSPKLVHGHGTSAPANKPPPQSERKKTVKKAAAKKKSAPRLGLKRF